MNKLLKGAIAGAAGLTLLLGGAGTFALWNSSTSITGGNIQSGELTLAGGGAGVWKDKANAVIPTISAYKIVPGDVLTYTKDLTVTATGATLTADLALADASIVAVTVATTADPAADAAQQAANNALKTSLTNQAVVTAKVVDTLISNTAYVVPANATTTIAVTVTITFPSSVSGTTGMLGSVNLSDVAVTLTQTTV